MESTGASAHNRLANTKERDFSTGLDNHGFRYYDKEIGRYISRDPIGYVDGYNVYLYVKNNPINGIDPESIGPTSVSTRFSSGPVSRREHYFKELPKPGSPFAKYMHYGNWAPQGWYKDKLPYKNYSFFIANLDRKYGANVKAEWNALAHRRLRAWGLNTMANWSDSEIYLQGKTAYTAMFYLRKVKPIAGSSGHWRQFHDVFDPSFRAAIKRGIAGRQKEVRDPWCIGFFVDNEMPWGDETSLAVAAMMSPANQAAKRELVKDLKDKYKTIGEINKAWGVKYASWQALLESRKTPPMKKAYADLAAFYSKLAETYFRTIKAELLAAGCHKLYLGCRFAWKNDSAVRASIKHCDVVSYNRYAYGASHLKLPDNADKPMIIGEFHFGAADRGVFHQGYTLARNQEERAGMLTNYVRSALRNPILVGVHWFQYAAQATTGRGDGENKQIGFVDICDTPYPELIKASADVGETMYEYRFNRRREK